jgi:hypothetical protein
MAKEKEKEKPEEGGKKPKHKMRSIHTHFTDDGGAVHEHHYEDHKGNPLPPRYGGVSSDMDDLHQHMDDHAGPVMSGADAGEQEPADGTEPEAPQAAGAPNAGTAGPEAE